MKFTPPETSGEALAKIDFSRAEPVAPENKALYDSADKGARAGDPSNATLMRFPDGTVCWIAKLAIDADGIMAGPGHYSGTQLDHADGQDDTSWHFPKPDGRALASEIHPFYVLPGADFGLRTGLALGDLCAVIHRNVITGALFGDGGPKTAIGEGSIALHEAIAPPDPCSVRDEHGRCRRVRNSSIECVRNHDGSYRSGVLVFAFPKSALEGLTWENLSERVRLTAYERFARFRA